VPGEERGQTADWLAGKELMNQLSASVCTDIYTTLVDRQTEHSHKYHTH